ncbi:hypothetical protein TREES_T100020208 [Tupaia chinensis]|uniref:Thioesterase domain-containing protein n=1 Tax=Tupaia chinensis TaxID=246437 RepID=L9LEU8_TUPCH|nr:hypothetical protein TREES_T100020208 [Tupaia chinensis]
MAARAWRLLARSACSSAAPSESRRLEYYRHREAYGYFLPIQTRWQDNDQYGHVNNAVYHGYFDTIVNHYLISSVRMAQMAAWPLPCALAPLPASPVLAFTGLTPRKGVTAHPLRAREGRRRDFFSPLEGPRDPFSQVVHIQGYKDSSAVAVEKQLELAFWLFNRMERCKAPCSLDLLLRCTQASGLGVQPGTTALQGSTPILQTLPWDGAVLSSLLRGSVAALSSGGPARPGALSWALLGLPLVWRQQMAASHRGPCDHVLSLSLRRSPVRAMTEGPAHGTRGTVPGHSRAQTPQPLEADLKCSTVLCVGAAAPGSCPWAELVRGEQPGPEL